MSPPASPTEDDSTTPNDESSTPIDGPTPPNADSTSPAGKPAPPVDEPPTTTSESESAPNTLLNALIGAVVTVLTSFFIPFAPVLGGATAGYLEGRDGAKVGVISGAMALVPLLFAVPIVLALVLFEPVVAFSILFIGLFVVGFLLIYTVGLSVLGGVIGVYLKNEM